MAGQGQIVDVGGSTTFTTSGPFLGRKDLGGIVYTWVQRDLEGIVDSDALLGVFLTLHEMAVANEYGHTRVLGLLGEATRHYPTAPWLDRDRAELVRSEDMSSSLLGKVNRVSLSRSSTFMTVPDLDAKVVGTTGGLPDFERPSCNGPVTLCLEPEDVLRLRTALDSFPPENPFAIMTCVPPEIAHCMVWHPAGAKKRQAMAITDYENRADPRFSANFLMFYGEQSQSSMHLMEDGFTFLLADADLSRARNALAAGEALSIRDEVGKVLLEIRPRC
jgi:hypothetical protein